MKGKKYILKYLYRDGIVDDNASKLLEDSKKRKFFIYFRDRERDQSYYLVTLKGNYIRGYIIRYEDENGEGINTFMGLVVPALITKQRPEITPKEVKTLLLKTSLKDYKKFVKEFKNLTPNLDWDTDEEIAQRKKDLAEWWAKTDEERARIRAEENTETELPC